MSKFWKLAGIVTLVAVLGVATVGAVAYAQEAGDGWPFSFGERFQVAIAEVLGISVDEYDAAVETAQGQVLDEAVAEGWLTEDQAEQMRERMAEGPGPRGGKFGHGPRGMMGGRGGSILDIAAEMLDMTPQDLLAELQDDESIAEVAEAHDVDPQAIADAYLAEIGDRLEQAVEDGHLTQQRADWMLEQAGEMLDEHLYEPFEDCLPGGMHRRGSPGRPGGGFPRFPGQTEGSSS